MNIELKELQPRNPYVNNVTAAYITAINILAVEFLIKYNEPNLYARYIERLYGLTEAELDSLFIVLDYNKHTSSLGAMITQGDYDEQKRILYEFLDDI